MASQKMKTIWKGAWKIELNPSQETIYIKHLSHPWTIAIEGTDKFRIEGWTPYSNPMTDIPKFYKPGDKSWAMEL
jgi:hypothetical protein